MNPIAAVLGVGTVCFLILYFSNMLSDKHEHLKRYIALVFVITLLLIPKVLMDDSAYCEIVLNSTYETYVYGNNFTGDHWDYEYPPPNNTALEEQAFVFQRNITNSYDRVCFENPNSTPSTLYRIVTWIMYGVLIYTFLAFFWFIVKDLMDYRKKKSQW